MRRAVFLDRDGVLNKALVRDGKPFSPDAIAEMEIIDGAAEALGLLRGRGFRLVVVTNQPDVARGRLTRQQVDAMNDHLRSHLPLDVVEVCWHDDPDRCDCRKPKPGLLLRAATRDGIALRESFMVGDRWRDIEAGNRARCRTVLIGEGYGEAFKSLPDVAVGNLSEAVGWILSQPPVK